MENFPFVISHFSIVIEYVQTEKFSCFLLLLLPRACLALQFLLD
jgi:hypothetical protein